MLRIALAGALWALAVFDILYPVQVLAPAMAILLVGFVALALPRTGRHTQALCGALAAATAGLAAAYGRWDAVSDGIARAAIFPAFLSTIVLLRAVADQRPEIAAARRMFAALDPARRWVFEPWLGGRALSLSLLASADGLELLSCNAIGCRADGGRLAVGAPEVGAADGWPGLRRAALELLPELAAAVPGLRGYVGVDGVWDGRRLTVLELNPRLTLAYAGLAERLGAAELLRRTLAAAGAGGAA